jgi:hypothetical protein
MRQLLLRLRAAIYKPIRSDYESLIVLLSSVTCPHPHNRFHYAWHLLTSAQADAYVCLVPSGHRRVDSERSANSSFKEHI